MTSHNSQPLLSKKVRILAPIVLYGICIISNFILRQVRLHHEFIMGQYWPISIISPKLPAAPDILTLAAVLCFGCTLWKLYRQKKPFWLQMGVVWLLVLATNLLQGFQWGYSTPTTSNRVYDVGYWEDAKTIRDPLNFIRYYTIIQPNLGYHSRVHPPLVPLVYYLFQQISPNPVVTSVLLSLIAVGTLWFLYDWLRRYIPDTYARYTALLFGLSSAFQIYSLATIDAVICLVFTAVLWAFDQPGRPKLKTSMGLLSLAALFTFGAVWLIPVLFVIDAVRQSRLKNFFPVIGGAVGIFIVIHILTGYSYLEGYRIAKSFEFSSLFTFSLPGILSFVSSRIMDLAEPILFLGPYLSLLIYRAIVAAFKPMPASISLLSRRFAASPLTHFGLISLAAMCSFLGFIAFGAYYTGETARAALYIIPPIITVVGPSLARQNCSPANQKTLLMAVLSQTVFMQLFFNFCW